MALPLPPKSKCSPSYAARVFALLDSIIAYRSAAASTYQFYEEVDAWLGPWGMSGYPIGYGKKYNILFSTNCAIARDGLGRSWFQQTTILLQEALRDYLVDRVKKGTLGMLTQDELRNAAFNSHPDAYLKGGLLDVVEKSPELFFVILTIPYEEFNPSNPNFFRTVKQVIGVISRAGLLNMLRAIDGATDRSDPRAILLRWTWQVAASKIPFLPAIPPGAADDNFWDSLGIWGGIANALDR